MTYMLTSHEEQTAREWEKYKGYTVRPLDSTIAYYAHLITSVSSHSSFLLYGGTPEIRSIFQNLDRAVVLLDRSEAMVRAMGRLTHARVPMAKNECFIQSDWLTSSLLDNKYDFIIGDDAINMVQWNDFELFLKNTQQMLNEDGVFVCHLLVKPDDEFIHQDFFALVQAYEEGSIKSTYDLASRLNFICYDKPTYAMGWQKTIQTLGKNKLAFLKPDFDFVDIFGLCNSKFYCPPQREFENLVEKYFVIEEIFYPHEHAYCLFEPVYLLKNSRGK